MDTYKCVRDRLLFLLEERKMPIYRLSIESGVAPSTIKNILYGKSKNPGIVTIKMLCSGLGISINDFFNTEDFKSLEPEL